VPCQNTHNVFVLDRDSLAPIVPPLGVIGAHGACMAPTGKTFYTTNFPGNGVAGLVTIDTETNTILGATDTGSPPIPAPHNVVLTPNGKKLYVTHSGATGDQVTVYRVPKPEAAQALGTVPGVPIFLTSVKVGLNPFGLAFVP